MTKSATSVFFAVLFVSTGCYLVYGDIFLTGIAFLSAHTKKVCPKIPLFWHIKFHKPWDIK
jgi:hypothetical protein